MSAVDVVVTSEFADWYATLDEDGFDAVNRVVSLLEQRGVNLGYPYSSAVQSSRHPLRELRAQAGGRPLRILYAFDPERKAVLLLGGDKTGDNRFYEKAVPKAERLWAQYLAELKRFP